MNQNITSSYTKPTVQRTISRAVPNKMTITCVDNLSFQRRPAIHAANFRETLVLDTELLASAP
jgi:hypothetical protein